MATSINKDMFLSPEPNNNRRPSRRAAASGCSAPRSSASSSCSFDSPTTGRMTASIPPSPFMQKLGCGTGVSVYLFQRGSDHGTGLSPWAVKKTMARTQHPDSIDNNTIMSIEKMLAKEASILKNLKHENIVGFRAFNRSQDGKMCLSMENGEKSLLDIIEFRDVEGLGPFPASQIYNMALGLAKGLCYLHSEKHLLHGDLKSGNILIGGDFESVKLCDFGVTLKLKEDLSGLEDPAEHYVGTEPWTAPEVINDEGPVTDKADIFSYGLVLWEMMALTVPHLDQFGDSSYSADESIDDSFQEAQYQAALGTRPPLPDFPLGTQYGPLISLFWACTDEDPTKRPSAKVVVQALESIQISDDTDYVEDKENIPMEDNL